MAFFQTVSAPMYNKTKPISEKQTLRSASFPARASIITQKLGKRPQSAPIPPNEAETQLSRVEAQTQPQSIVMPVNLQTTGVNRQYDNLDRRKDIVIHVFDENRNAKRDFLCKKHLLLREMKYFAGYFNDKNVNEYVEIDVHCDVEVFEWLMSYTMRQKPSLEPRTATSILISSNFLQMAALEEICLNYIFKNINEIVKGEFQKSVTLKFSLTIVPIDMSCINSKLMSRLASLFTPEDLLKVNDPRNRIL
ncbi:hypothetical protein HK096_011117, partial [Nowakowskiella sp. JEL0078]